VADHVANTLCQLDPKSCGIFKANLKKFEDRLEAKIIEWKKLLAPYKGKEIVTYHNYWIYFAKAFDLKMDLFLEPKPGIPPTPAHLAEVIAKMKSDNVKLIVVQPYQNRKTAETVAGHTGSVVLDWPSFPMTSKETESYIDWMDFTVKSLAKGLGKQQNKSSRARLCCNLKVCGVSLSGRQLMVEVMQWPLIACLLLPGILVYLELHIVQREIIFVDLALAQWQRHWACLGICCTMTQGPGSYGLSPWLHFDGRGDFHFDANGHPSCPTGSVDRHCLRGCGSVGDFIVEQQRGRQ
jgi:hypothetical protein